MKVYLLHFISDTNFDKEIEEIKNIKPDKIFGIITTEPAAERWFSEFIRKIQNYLINNNTTFTIINIWSPDTVKIENCTLETSAGSLSFGITLLDIYKNYDGNQIVNSEKLYTCYNRNPVYGRAVLIDNLAKENLLNDGVVTFHHPDNVQIHSEPKFVWKYHDGSKLMDELDYIHPAPPGHTGKIYYSSDIPASYLNGFIDVICETEGKTNYVEECYYFSEKSYKALLIGKPFITLQAANFHKKYVRDFYGLELYEELFDYSFDNCENLNDRILGIVENIKKLKPLLTNKSDKQKLYDIIKPKLDYNRNRLIQLANDPDFMIPKSIRFIFESNIEVFGDYKYIDIINYIRSKGWNKNSYLQ